MNSTSSQSAAASATEQDPTSLRAAALLTLKSKRRKVQKETPNFSLPSRPPPPEAGLQLDYGQDELPSTTLSQSPSSPKLEAKRSPAQEPPSEVREEGEISDEDNEQPPIAPQNFLLPPLRYHRNITATLMHLARDSMSTQPSRAKLSDRLSNPHSASDLVPPPYGILPELQHAEPISAPRSPIQAPVQLPSEDVMRPGMQLNQVQYERAKDLILDLLGWGVAPEYLIDCGVTRETVFYVFTDLNLRLPQNLDLEGLVPYSQDVVISSPSTQTRACPESPSIQPQPSQQDIVNSPSPSVSRVASTSHAPPVSPPEASSESVPTTASEDNLTSAASGDLNDMERQRRQELLARKAAITSRGSKQVLAAATTSPSPVASTSGSSTFSSGTQDVEMAVISETVDNFLKTITPTSALYRPSDLNALPPSNEDMDVDEVHNASALDQRNATITSFASNQVSSLKTPITPVESSAFTEEVPPPSTELASMVPGVQSSDSSSNASAPSEKSALRRGSKRPVAADFVDFDTGTRPSSSASNGYANGVNTGSRRKTGIGFANVVSARRFIIDLSDSEGEGEGEADDAQENRKANTRFHTPHTTQRIPLRPSLNLSSGRSTPSIATPTPSLPSAGAFTSGFVTPALAEKEMEIKRMRELIAERERRRIEKKAALKADTEASVSAQQTLVKQQDASAPLSTNDDGNVENTELAGEGQAKPGTSPVDVMSTSSSSSTSPTIDVAFRNAITHPDPNHQVSSTDANQKHVVIMEDQQTKTSGSVDVDPAPSTSTQERTTSSAHPKPVENQSKSADTTAALQGQRGDNYLVYDSPLKLYPLIASRARAMYTSNPQAPNLATSRTSNSSQPLLSHSSSSSSSSFLFSSSIAATTSISSSPTDISSTSILSSILGPLNLGIASRKLDPSKRICQYEVPGGGVCRDEGCEDVHLGRIPGLSDGGAEPSDQETAEYLVDNVLGPDWLVAKSVSLPKVTLALQNARLRNSGKGIGERIALALATLG